MRIFQSDCICEGIEMDDGSLIGKFLNFVVRIRYDAMLPTEWSRF